VLRVDIEKDKVIRDVLFFLQEIFVSTIMSLTDEQRKVVEDAQRVLQESGIAAVSHIPTDTFVRSLQNICNSSTCTLSPPLLSYILPTASFPLHGHLRVTRKSSSAVHCVIDHLLGAIVEYPQTGSVEIRSRFEIEHKKAMN